MNTKEAKQSVQMDKALFDFYGKPSIGQSLPLAVQHVCIIFTTFNIHVKNSLCN